MSKRLRFGPACYHVLHLIPIQIAHEMNFFYDEGLRDEDGKPSYEIVRGGMAPFMFEKETLAQRMKELDIDIAMDGCFNKPSTVAYPQKKGHELYIVAGRRNNQPNHVVGANKIKSLEQLRGKRIGVIDVDDILVTALRPWLKRAGVDPYNDVTWVRGNAPHEARARLRAGTIDAAFHAQRGSGRLSDRHSDLRKSLGERLLKLRRAEKRRGKSMERVFHQDEFRI